MTVEPEESFAKSASQMQDAGGSGPEPPDNSAERSDAEARGRPTAARPADATPHETADSCWDLEDLDSAYRRALAATEFLEEELVAALRDAGDAVALDEADAAAGDAGAADAAKRQGTDAPAAGLDASSSEPAGRSAADATQEAPDGPGSAEAGAGFEDVARAAIVLDGRPRRAPRADPMHVIEAVLFVGGPSFTARRLAALLGAEDRVEAVEDLIERLRERYWQQRRPYTIQLEEGGYRMVLRSEFERYRERTYGLAPREVKLSADAIAVLAAVAYRQPIGRKELDELCRQNTAGPLRQLLRLKLITVERDAGSKEVSYRTTPRFLELFGLRRLEDLPEPEDFEFK